MRLLTLHATQTSLKVGSGWTFSEYDVLVILDSRGARSCFQKLTLTKNAESRCVGDERVVEDGFLSTHNQVRGYLCKDKKLNEDKALVLISVENGFIYLPDYFYDENRVQIKPVSSKDGKKNIAVVCLSKNKSNHFHVQSPDYERIIDIRYSGYSEGLRTFYNRGYLHQRARDKNMNLFQSIFNRFKMFIHYLIN